ncbi:hypothetical protein [Nocardiopsis changdeensis]|uniref:hypothetical protein n=1 Tax=Nocardiopsis changdeensis TaxID=2831969 RepID=UPI003F462CEE
MSDKHRAACIAEQVKTLDTPTNSAVLLRLNEALELFGIRASIDRENGEAVFLHTDTVSVWVRREYFHIEHVDNDGNPRRHLTVRVSRLPDAARLVATYEGCLPTAGGET